ncbi:MAG: pyridoxal-phosphate dependent enzyme [Cyclobacteriaceae bacterium]
MVNYRNTPIIELESKFASGASVRLFLKREDLNHPSVSGNKWWKLKFNLEQALKSQHKSVLTFGGAFSNHLYATSAAASDLGLNSIGIVRGEETLPLNPTLAFCAKQGMQLHYISREQYKEKDQEDFIESLREKLGDFYLIPEGGTNALAVKGCEEWAMQIRAELDFDYLCLPVGTGGTMAGMINILKDKSIIGFSSLKGGSFLEGEIKPWLTNETPNWGIETQYHFGGYAKTNSELNEFIDEFERSYSIPLDRVYTAKMMFGLKDLIKQKKFERGSRILALHTGGLQGRTISS